MDDSNIVISVHSDKIFLFNHILKFGTNTVGRDQSRDVIIPTTDKNRLGVSREHVTLTINNGTESTHTLIQERVKGADNPTYINGYEIELGKETGLRKGDIVSLGERGCRFMVSGLDDTNNGPFPEIEVLEDRIKLNGRSLEHDKLNANQNLGLRYFWDNQGKLLEWGVIYEAIFKEPPAGGTIAARDYCAHLVSTLRKVLNERYSGFLIQTIPGKGYLFRKPKLEWTSLT